MRPSYGILSHYSNDGGGLEPLSSSKFIRHVPGVPSRALEFMYVVCATRSVSSPPHSNMIFPRCAAAYSRLGEANEFHTAAQRPLSRGRLAVTHNFFSLPTAGTSQGSRGPTQKPSRPGRGFTVIVPPPEAPMCARNLHHLKTPVFFLPQPLSRIGLALSGLGLRVHLILILMPVGCQSR
jgi:hypothetical protein